MIEHALEHGERLDPRWMSKAMSHLAHLTMLINDLLDVTHIEAGQWKLEREGDELTVEADPARLKQVVTNLVDNAIKYSPGGGLVHVRLARHDEEAILSVSDQGIGIPAEQQAELFERFFRARNAPAPSSSGSRSPHKPVVP
jgi:signal transduction histidine kinase